MTGAGILPERLRRGTRPFEIPNKLAPRCLPESLTSRVFEGTADRALRQSMSLWRGFTSMFGSMPWIG